MRNLENIMNTIINGDSVKVMSELPDSIIDLVVTSPKYNVGIDYDSCDDEMSMEDYWVWTEQWLTQSFRLLKDDGRIAVNIPYEINVQDRGGRVLFMSEFWSVMKKVGFKFYGLVDLDENSPHRSKTTAWGSWMSPSSPYIYNPKECVILAYKKDRIKKVKGEPQWVGEVVNVEQEDGTIKKKTMYQDEDKKEFMSLVYGQWEYFADTKQKTKATFSLDIPSKAIKILTYKNDVIMDPFTGSGTSLVAAEILERRWIGIELSPNYCEVATERVQHFINQKKQVVLDFESKT
jgi:site-specific DNA-methyltransferase (adenine-specific)